MKVKVINNGEWHSNIKVTTDGGSSFKLTDNLSGCGTMILHNYTGVEKTDLYNALGKVLDSIKNNKGADLGIKYSSLDIGAIITTIGQSHYKNGHTKAL